MRAVDVVHAETIDDTMQWSELRERLAGAGWPTLPVTGSNQQLYQRLLGLPRPGSGSYHHYTERHFRLLVSWCRFGDITGQDGGVASWQTTLRRVAVELMADRPDGWVVISNRLVVWQPHPPMGDLGAGVVALTVHTVWERSHAELVDLLTSV